LGKKCLLVMRIQGLRAGERCKYSRSETAKGERGAVEGSRVGQPERGLEERSVLPRKGKQKAGKLKKARGRERCTCPTLFPTLLTERGKGDKLSMQKKKKMESGRCGRPCRILAAFRGGPGFWKQLLLPTTRKDRSPEKEKKNRKNNQKKKKKKKQRKKKGSKRDTPCESFRKR